jgi:hypothetical protein
MPAFARRVPSSDAAFAYSLFMRLLDEAKIQTVIMGFKKGFLKVDFNPQPSKGGFISACFSISPPWGI